MKDIKNFILEVQKDKYGNDILLNDEVTLEEIKNAIYAGSFMKDRATIYLGDDENNCRGSYDKIAKNKWHFNPNQEHALGGNYSDEEMFNFVQNAKYIKMYLK